MLILPYAGVAIAAKAWGIDGSAPPLSLQNQVKVMMGAYALQSLGVIAFVLLHARAERSGDGVRRWPWWRSLAMGAMAIVLAWPVLVAAAAIARPIVILLTGQPPSVIAHQTLRLFIDNSVDGWYIALAASALVVAPIFEEIAYRGILQTSLSRAMNSRWLAIAITSVIFAAAHGTVDAHALPVLFVLSLAFGWAYERSGRLAVPIVIHVLFNASNFTLALMTASESAPMAR